VRKPLGDNGSSAGDFSPKVHGKQRGQLSNVPDYKPTHRKRLPGKKGVVPAKRPVADTPLLPRVSTTELSAEVDPQARQKEAARKPLGNEAANAPDFLPPRSGNEFGRLTCLPMNSEPFERWFPKQAARNDIVGELVRRLQSDPKAPGDLR